MLHDAPRDVLHAHVRLCDNPYWLFRVLPIPKGSCNRRRLSGSGGACVSPIRPAEHDNKTEYMRTMSYHQWFAVCYHGSRD